MLPDETVARFRDNARGQIIGDTDGMLKLVFDPTGASVKHTTSDPLAPDFAAGGAA